MNAAGQQRIARVAIAALLLAPAMTIPAAPRRDGCGDARSTGQVRR
jgi:hypothetical protein